MVHETKTIKMKWNLFDNMMVKWRNTDFLLKIHSTSIYKSTGGFIFGRFISRDIVLIFLQTLIFYFQLYLRYYVKCTIKL